MVSPRLIELAEAIIGKTLEKEVSMKEVHILAQGVLALDRELVLFKDRNLELSNRVQDLLIKDAQRQVRSGDVSRAPVAQPTQPTRKPVRTPQAPTRKPVRSPVSLCEE